MPTVSETRIAATGLLAFLAILGASIAAQKTLGAGFLPHGYCFTWIPGLLWLNVISDALIALAYLSIPLTLAYFVKHRPDLPFSWVFVLFGVFIVACGTTHALDVWTVWTPDYWLAGGVKAITAAASVPTAAALVWLMPKALAIPSVRQLQDANEALRREVAARKMAEEKLEESKDHLRTLVSERTAELDKTTALLDAFFESSPLALAVFDSKLRFVKVNPTLASISKLPMENHWGRPFVEVDPDVDPLVTAALKEVRNGSTRVVQVEIDGKPVATAPTTWRITVHSVPRTQSDPLIGYACEIIPREAESHDGTH
jgi:PAS domain-containing protein